MSLLIYEETESFSKAFRKIAKRYRTLPVDFEGMNRAAIELYHVHQMDNQSCFELQGYANAHCQIYKVKKFACRSLPGKGSRSGLRVIYAYFPCQQKICFLDIYYKERGDTTAEVRVIKEFLKS